MEANKKQNIKTQKKIKPSKSVRLAFKKETEQIKKANDSNGFSPYVDPDFDPCRYYNYSTKGRNPQTVS